MVKRSEKRRCLSGASLFLSAFIACGIGQTLPAFSQEFVPDAAAAIKIARPRLAKIFGAEQIRKEEPLKAKRKNDMWKVEGTLNCETSTWEKWFRWLAKPVCLGGVAEIMISAKDGHVLNIQHGE